MAIRDPNKLNLAQDAVYSNRDYWPKSDETFCNIATQDVLSRLNYRALDGMTADEMYAYVSTSKEWIIKPMADAQKLANEGVILLGILPAIKLGQSHGHVNTLTPGVMDYSGMWDMRTALCMNLGRMGTCSRNRGENFAFHVIPEIYALVETL